MRFFAQISDWTRLAELYPAIHLSEGQEYTQQTVQVGAVRYRKCMTVGIGSQGLYLWARPILSRYQPVLIPWGEIKGMQEARMYWQRVKLLSIGNPQVATVRVPLTLFRSIQPNLSPNLS